MLTAWCIVALRNKEPTAAAKLTDLDTELQVVVKASMAQGVKLGHVDPDWADQPLAITVEPHGSHSEIRVTWSPPAEQAA